MTLACFAFPWQLLAETRHSNLAGDGVQCGWQHFRLYITQLINAHTVSASVFLALLILPYRKECLHCTRTDLISRKRCVSCGDTSRYGHTCYSSVFSALLIGMLTLTSIA